jgi:hypothetical protein
MPRCLRAICAIALSASASASASGAVSCISLGTIDGDDPGNTPTDGGKTHSRDDAARPRVDSGEAPLSPDGGGHVDAGAPDAAPIPADDPELPLARGVTISEIAMFQAVKIDLEKGGTRVPKRNADVVAGREGVLRVYVSGASGELVGKLELSTPGGTATVITTKWTPSATPSDGSLASTLNFDVEAGALAIDTSFMVSLHTAIDSGTGPTDGARYPASGTPEPLGARDTGPALKITIVPVKDGSGRLPDVSAAQVEEYRRSAYAMYPARKVEITVRAPYDWGGRIDASGGGFDELLDSMVSLRVSDRAPRDVYYYGAFANASSFDAFCGGGCVTGLCGLTDDPMDATVRACVGVGFTGKYSAETMTHEVGHAHGRYHAPCGGAAGTDPRYPYSGARLGVWGYDVVAKKLMDPAKNVDLMSYCNPVFVSDFQYQGLLERMASIATTKMIKLPAPATYRFVRVRGDGALSWGRRVELHEPPLGGARAIAFDDARGTTTLRATGHYYPYDHLAGGMLLVPEPKVPYAALRVEGLAGTVAARLDATLDE